MESNAKARQVHLFKGLGRKSRNWTTSLAGSTGVNSFE
jgi:hypothetical protein